MLHYFHTHITCITYIFYIVYLYAYNAIVNACNARPCALRCSQMIKPICVCVCVSEWVCVCVRKCIISEHVLPPYSIDYASAVYTWCPSFPTVAIEVHMNMHMQEQAQIERTHKLHFRWLLVLLLLLVPLLLMEVANGDNEANRIVFALHVYSV